MRDIKQRLNSFKSGCHSDDIKKLQAVVINQIKKDKKKKSKAALKRIENNKLWLIVYDYLLEHALYEVNYNRIMN